MNNRAIFWCALLMESGISFWLQNEQDDLEYSPDVLEIFVWVC